MVLQLLTITDYQMAARDRLPKAVYEYLTSGADDEQTVASNETAYSLHWVLRPRVLRPILPHLSSTTTTLLGRTISLPLFASPAGVHGLFHAEGECYTAATCRDFGIPFGLSQHSTRSIEEIAQVGGNLWYQAYILKNRSHTVDMIRRAVVSKAYAAICFTVDSVKFGVRHADARNGFDALPFPHRLVNYDRTFAQGDTSGGADETYNSQQNAAWDQNSEQLFDINLSLDDIGWIKSIIRDHCSNNDNGTTKTLPVIVKGVMTPEDAVRCAQAGADAIVVSNHGGRQLDGCLATIDALPAVVTALRAYARESNTSCIPILLDGGIRRGTDILKALALGATAVGIGRPLFYGLAVNDLPGLLNILRRELETAMALCGVNTVADIYNACLVQHRSTSPYHYPHDCCHPEQSKSKL
jgi:isopentenyl diphosphate isomerase/L-lactate dehydrogenase-like FMN-dependent dehydrogenase